MGNIVGGLAHPAPSLVLEETGQVTDLLLHLKRQVGDSSSKPRT